MWLERKKWTELASMKDYVYIVPLGSIEQHGPHLPLVTDTAIVTEIARRVEAARPETTVITPTLWLGHSPHHEHFGCVSAHLRPYMEMLNEVCRSLVRIGARRIFLLNGHGGNDIPVKASLRELKTEFASQPEVYVVYATYWSLSAAAMKKIRSSPTGGMGHACEMETSIMLHLRPDDVKLAAAVDSPCADPSGRVVDMLEGAPYTAVFEFDEFSPTGTIGLPSHASAEKGEQFLEGIAESVTAFVDSFAKWTRPGQVAG